MQECDGPSTIVNSRGVVCSSSRAERMCRKWETVQRRGFRGMKNFIDGWTFNDISPLDTTRFGSLCSCRRYQKGRSTTSRSNVSLYGVLITTDGNEMLYSAYTEKLFFFSVCSSMGAFEWRLEGRFIFLSEIICWRLFGTVVSGFRCTRTCKDYLFRTEAICVMKRVETLKHLLF